MAGDVKFRGSRVKRRKIVNRYHLLVARRRRMFWGWSVLRLRLAGERAQEGHESVDLLSNREAFTFS